MNARPDPTSRSHDIAPRTTILIVCTCFFATGAAGLVYEVVWNRVLALHMGNTSYALATLLAVFMGGLALGAWLGGRFAPRGRHGLLAYALLELGTGVYCAVLPKLIDLADPLFARIYRDHYSTLVAFNLLQFAAAAALLILPTVLMGATLPILVRALVTHFASLGRMVGFLYAVNAGGAFAGAILTGLLWLPRLGSSATYRIAIAINLIVGLVVVLLWRFSRAQAPAAEPGVTAARAVPSSTSHAFDRAFLLTGFLLCGFAAMVLQVAWTRTVTMAIGSTTYAFALIAGTFILGLSLGSWLLGWMGDRSWGHIVLGFTPFAIGLAAIYTIVPLGELPVKLSTILAGTGTPVAAAPGTGASGAVVPSYGLLQWRMFFEVFLIFIGPTLGMGALFPLLARTVARQLSDVARAVGDTYTVNAIGTILGAALTGFVLIPWLGMRTSILAAAGIYALVGATYLAQVLRAWPRLRLLAPVAVVVLAGGAAFAAPQWDRSILTSGPYVNAARFAAAGSREQIRARMQQSIVFYKEGEAEVVSVVDLPNGRRNLVINGKTDAVSFHPTQNWLGHLPLFLRPSARRVLVLGLGSGNTLASIEEHDNVRSIDVLEISRGVVHAAREYFGRYTHDALDDPRAQLVIGDGRLHLRHTAETYDVIVSQPSNPWIVGAAALFTRESFVAMKRRLAPGGVACIWVQIANMPAENIRILANTWADVWSYPSVWRPSGRDALLFIGSEHALSIDLEQVNRKLANPRLRESMQRIDIASAEVFIAKLVAADEGVRAAVRGAMINTDDNSRIEYDTPPNAMTRDESQRIWALFQAYRVDPYEYVVSSGKAPEPVRPNP
jgi:spermidine synthase